MKIKKEEEDVEEDSSAPKIFGKTKSKRKVKKDKTPNSSEALPLQKVVVPFLPEDAKPTKTLLPETTRRSSRARKPSAKAERSCGGKSGDRNEEGDGKRY